MKMMKYEKGAILRFSPSHEGSYVAFYEEPTHIRSVATIVENCDVYMVSLGEEVVDLAGTLWCQVFVGGKVLWLESYFHHNVDVIE
jgi:hypothetical protein